MSQHFFLRNSDTFEGTIDVQAFDLLLSGRSKHVLITAFFVMIRIFSCF